MAEKYAVGEQSVADVRLGGYYVFTPPTGVVGGGVGTGERPGVWYGTKKLREYSGAFVDGQVVKVNPKSVVIRNVTVGDWNYGHEYKIPKDASATRDLTAEMLKTTSFKPVQVAGADSTKAKEPWQMTREEYQQVWDKHLVEKVGLPSGQNAEGIASSHKGTVKVALAQGKPVPPEVLKDYPDLKPVAPETPALKEPWQITREEWLNEGKGGITNRNIPYGRDKHKESVEYALSSGKPIPPEVLKDYPDLAKRVWGDAAEPSANLITDLKTMGYTGKKLDEALRELAPAELETVASPARVVRESRELAGQERKAHGDTVVARTLESGADAIEVAKIKGKAADKGELLGRAEKAIAHMKAQTNEAVGALFKSGNPHLSNIVGLEPSWGSWENFLKDAKLKEERNGWKHYTSANAHYIVSPEGYVADYYGYHGNAAFERLSNSRVVADESAELQSVHDSRSDRSRESDERQEHSTVIEPDSPAVAKWLKDPGRMDVRGIDTPKRRASKPKRSSRSHDKPSTGMGAMRA